MLQDITVKGRVTLKAYTKQELEDSGFFAKLLGSKPSGNAWKEINNLLADAASADEISAARIQETVKKMGRQI